MEMGGADGAVDCECELLPASVGHQKVFFEEDKAKKEGKGEKEANVILAATGHWLLVI
jgi:hypothetical protein